MVLGEKSFNSFLAVSTGGLDFRIEVVKSDERQNSMTKFWFFVFVDAPEAFDIPSSLMVIARLQNFIEVRGVKAL